MSTRARQKGSIQYLICEEKSMGGQSVMRHSTRGDIFQLEIQIQTLMANIQFTSRKGSWRPRQCKAAVMRALLVTGSPIKEPRKLSTAMLNNKNTSCCAAPSEFSRAVPVIL